MCAVHAGLPYEALPKKDACKAILGFHLVVQLPEALFSNPEHAACQWINVRNEKVG